MNLPLEIGDRVWHDLNGNGIQDDGSMPPPPPLPADVSWTFDYTEDGRSRAVSEPVFIGSGVVAGPGLFGLGLVEVEMFTVPRLFAGQGKVHTAGHRPQLVGANVSVL